MLFTVSTTRFSQYVQLEVAGPSSLKNFVEMVSAFSGDTLYWSDRRALVDLRKVVGELTPPEQVFLGEMVAQDLSHLERIASIVPEALVTHNSENAAQQMGMRLRVFSNKDDAVAWLTAPSPAGADAASARAAA
ncbi:MAG: STAS/SEC14 domain-containing protein [Ramlibacter sp.]